MGLNLAAMEKITADVQMNDLKWVEVGEGSYFKVLTVHEPTNTVAFSYKMDAGAPDFPSHFHICRAMAWTIRGWYGYRESENPVESRIHTGMFSYEAAGSFHTPYSDCPEGFETVGILRAIRKCFCKTIRSLIQTLSESVICWWVTLSSGPARQRILSIKMAPLLEARRSNTTSRVE